MVVARPTAGSCLLLAPAPNILLDSSVNPVGRVSASWSSAIADRYGLKLSPDWVEWFDSLPTEGVGAGEFTEPVHPQVLLEPAPEVIWPGLMFPDLLPIIGNGMGDWLCGRVGADNTILEVVHWYHGGGDCLPHGKSLAEALLYNAVSGRFPGRARGLAIPAEPPRESVGQEGLGRLHWALSHLPSGAAAWLDPRLPAMTVAETLADCGIAEVAVRCDLILAALDNPVRRRMTPAVAASCDAHWEREVVRWMFDPDQLPAEVRQRLTAKWDLGPADWQSQDWEVAAAHAARVASVRSDLAWAHDVLGWHDQRQGRIEEAIEHYLRGAWASAFTDQSVRFRTHFDSDRVGKFAVARLIDLGAAPRLDSEYLERLRVGVAATDSLGGWRDRVSSYWLERADRVAEEADRASRGPAAAAVEYDLIYRAGWDVGCDAIQHYRELLGRLAATAEAAGQTARAAVARAHQACLASRYFFD